MKREEVHKFDWPEYEEERCHCGEPFQIICDNCGEACCKKHDNTKHDLYERDLCLNCQFKEKQ